MIELLNIDCMEYMATLPDKAFDLAIVDPPYGIGFDGEVPSMCLHTGNTNKTRRDKWRNPKMKGYVRKEWDNKTPTDEYFNQLFRVSKNQIIWGANHFNLPQSKGWVFWDKLIAKGFSLADGELAWTSFDKAVKKFTYLWAGFAKAEPINRIHPTQKPVALYKWLLHNYAKEGNKILDTHLGSGSSAIAAHKMGFDFVGCELDKDYYDAACKRFKEQTAQLPLF